MEADLGETANFPPAGHVHSAILWPRPAPRHRSPTPAPYLKGAVFFFSVCLLDDVLVMLAVTRELTRAIRVPFSSQQEAGKTGQRASPPSEAFRSRQVIEVS